MPRARFLGHTKAGHPHHADRANEMDSRETRIFEVRDLARGRVLVTEAESEADALDRYALIHPVPREPIITELRP